MRPWPPQFNDDMLIGKPLPRGYFFDELGRPVQHDHKRMPPQDTNVSAFSSPNIARLSHGPTSMTKSLVREVQDLWPKWFDKLSSMRCRSKLYPPFWAYQWFVWIDRRFSPSEGRTNSTNGGVKFICMPCSFWGYSHHSQAPLFTLTIGPWGT